MEQDKKVEHEKSEVPVLTTEKLLQAYTPIVEDVVEFPDGTMHKIKIRRFNSTEIFSSFGTYTFTREDTLKDSDEKISDEKIMDILVDEDIQVGIQVMQETVIMGMEEPQFKYKDTDGEGYPVESLTHDMISVFYMAVGKINNPEEVDKFFTSFRKAIGDRKRTYIDNTLGQESGEIPPETVSDDTSGTDN